jgi:hypothetical protein
MCKSCTDFAFISAVLPPSSLAEGHSGSDSLARWPGQSIAERCPVVCLSNMLHANRCWCLSFHGTEHLWCVDVRSVSSLATTPAHMWHMGFRNMRLVNMLS